MKHMFKDDTASRSSRDIEELTREGGRSYDSEGLNDPSRSSKLPTGTGPGTTGKVGSERVMEHDLDRARSDQGIAGYGTDAAAATGGSLAGAHQDARSSTGSTHSGTIPGTKQSATIANPDAGGGSRPGEFISVTREFGRSEHREVLDDRHVAGHRKRDVMPTGDTQEDTSQLNPVTHEYIRHLETEEVERIKDLERHVHHVQHHTQPVVARQDLPEGHKDFEHGAKERTVVDKGTKITEHVHHHVHHVIQPVIEKETIDRQHIHTTIPIHEVTQEAPIVHQSQTHAPIPMDHFVERGGALRGGTTPDVVEKTLLREGKCIRTVDGVAEDMEKRLHLGKESTTAVHSKDPELIKTKVTQRTTTVVDPDLYQGPAPAGRN
ncbi:hypothetical protein CC1G_02186 [Coprinopsis cinerea okayama7|uniref:Allergen n=1 Tax=Coprinopsis cinerea (strain Okayama-7 / 130 / ATCC MYA-4618 / FGSC 9003) TaxID=240176 RepID=A8NKH3_COPC7|nr:hypothetical protein CC1G_02186 [Coprinopsis cinerea okayama7\|eukprot:XP_001834450.2 hypothetical protein CC1G_02186 [Coprinopsis cinerea okayama7\